MTMTMNTKQHSLFLIIIKLDMGLLSVGSPLSWEETKKNAEYVREQGVKQFINQYHKFSKSTGAALFWGDEIEYTLMHIDPITKEATLLLMAAELLPYLQWEETHSPSNTPLDMLWRPEYAGYMIEGTPGRPFGHLPEYLNTVEFNMHQRRYEVQKRLPDNCFIFCLTTFPRLGCPNFTFPPTFATPKEGVSHSLFYPDNAIFGAHPRYKTLTRNIRERRGSKVVINLPIFKDVNTPKPFIEDLTIYHDGSDPAATSAALPDHVYLDAMGFGMGCSCLQVTFQGCCISEARMLYDQLTTICPIVMALSAATPAIRGYLLDVDCRWGIISGAVDDRTEEERGEKPLNKDRFRILKSRYDSVSSFLSPAGSAYNDTDLPYNHKIYEELLEAGIDELLSKHISHLFIRDPISLFAENIEAVDENDTDQFENIQSTNWQSMRFKPPPANSDIGWRVEFRPMELQLTDFENAAFVTFIVLLTRTILSLKLNFLIPISKVEENMLTAVKRDAVNSENFYFRRGDLIFTDDSPQTAEAACREMQRSRTSSLKDHVDVTEKQEKYISLPSSAEEQNLNCAGSYHINDSNCYNCDNSPGTSNHCVHKIADVLPEKSYTKMNINEIINGNDHFPGLLALIRHYVSMTEVDPNTAYSIHQYLKLIEQKAAGRLPTTAKWMRDLIKSHRDYKHDSVLSSKVVNDLMADCLAVSTGKACASNVLLHDMCSSRTTRRPPAATLSAEESLHSKRTQSTQSAARLSLDNFIQDSEGNAFLDCSDHTIIMERAKNSPQFAVHNCVS